MMKAKIILLVSAVAALGFTSCSNEIDTQTEDKATSFTLELTTAGAQTKAGTTDPTTEESKVSSIHVAVFDVTNITDTASAPRVAIANSFSFVENKTSVTFDNLAAGRNRDNARKYMFYVIANSGVDFSKESDFRTYGKYQAYTLKKDPASLVKVGRKESSLYWLDDTKTNADSIHIEMIQLTARVEFVGIVGKESKVASQTKTATGIYEYDKTVTEESFEENYSLIFFNYLLKLEADPYRGGYSSNNIIHGVYGYLMDDTQFRLVRYIKKETIETTGAATTLTFTPKAIEFYGNIGINTNSDITIYNTAKSENTKKSFSFPSLDINKNPLFYTYETAEKVKLKVTGLWSKGEGSSGEIIERGYVIQLLGNSSSWENRNIQDGDIIIPDGDLAKTQSKSSQLKSDELAITKTYQLELPPLLKGNRYRITGTVEPFANPTITWKVEWDGNNTVEIPDFK